MLIPVAAIERSDIRSSVSRCWRLTSRHWARTLGLVAVVGSIFRNDAPVGGPTSAAVGRFRRVETCRIDVDGRKLGHHDFLPTLPASRCRRLLQAHTRRRRRDCLGLTVRRHLL